jgi:hypothetical protein
LQILRIRVTQPQALDDAISPDQAHPAARRFEDRKFDRTGILAGLSPWFAGDTLTHGPFLYRMMYYDADEFFPSQTR